MKQRKIKKEKRIINGSLHLCSGPFFIQLKKGEEKLKTKNKNLEIAQAVSSI